MGSISVGYSRVFLRSTLASYWSSRLLKTTPKNHMYTNDYIFPALSTSAMCVPYLVTRLNYVRRPQHQLHICFKFRLSRILYFHLLIALCPYLSWYTNMRCCIRSKRQKTTYIFHPDNSVIWYEITTTEGPRDARVASVTDFQEWLLIEKEKSCWKE